MTLYLWVPYSKEFVKCVYLCNSLHEARGRPGGLAWGQLQLWILSQVRVTLSPHYSLTWPHHYHSNSVNHDDSYALFSLSFIISTHRKMSCFSVFLGRESLKTPPTQEVHMRKMKVVMVTKRNQQKWIVLFPVLTPAIKKCFHSAVWVLVVVTKEWQFDHLLSKICCA